jgi:CheY-like chemotaxis protein
MMSESLSILVVDDSPSMATSLVDILDIKGFEVYAAQSGAEALEILREHAVDILLTDVIMPDMNGVELYREARKIHQNLTTFLMTAYAADGIIQQGMAEGIRTVLNKPLNIDFLLTLFSVTMGFITKED